MAGQKDTQSFQAETSTVGAKVPTALRDIPQAVTVIDRSLLESQGVTSFQDALRNAPGVTVGAAEGGTIGNNVNLRGFTARTDIYLDASATAASTIATPSTSNRSKSSTVPRRCCSAAARPAA